MAKMPFFKFFPADWIKDTRGLSLSTRGAWIDLLCFMWESPTRGTITRSKPVLARILGASEDELGVILDEIQNQSVCECVTERNGDVTLTSRRIVREEKVRQQTLCRVKRFRNAQKIGACNESVTVKKSEVRSQKSEARDKKTTTTASAQTKIQIDWEQRKWENISDEDKARWSKAYPAVDIDTSLLRALEWCISNPTKGKKSNYRKFLTNWFSRSQDRGGSRSNASGPDDDPGRIRTRDWAKVDEMFGTT